MQTTHEKFVDSVKSDVPTIDQLKRATSFTLSDAIRHGSQYSEQSTDFESCALAVAAHSASALEYM